jgi:hypothetical protein
MSEDFAGLTESERRHALSKLLLQRIGGPNRPHPLSYGQEARWALVNASPESGIENHSFAWRLGAESDPQMLRLAVEALLKSYACLRSVFGLYEGRAVRYVEREFVVPFTGYDEADAAEHQIDAAVAREASKPFDLRTGPLIRVGLFRRPGGEQTLLVTAHHIVVDFWSLGIALRKLGEAYLMLASGLAVEPRNDEADYDEFVLWEATRVTGPPGLSALRYWGSKFADGLDFVELPTDRGWPGQRAFRDAEYRFTVSAQLVGKLRAVGRERDCTLFAVMLALFNILIYSYTRQKTLAVISPVSIRSRLGFEEQVGDLSNFLLLAARIDERQDFDTFLLQVRQTVIDAMEHRDFPVSLVTKRIHVRKRPEGAVLFPLRFNMPRASQMKGDMDEPREGEPRLTVAFDAFHAELEFVDRRVTGSAELNLGLFRSQGGLLGSLQYNVELFDEATISRMVARLTHLAAIVCEGAAISIQDLVDACGRDVA